MKDEEAKKIVFRAAMELTKGVIANPASAAILGDSYQLTRTVETSVEVAKNMFDRIGFMVEK